MQLLALVKGPRFRAAMARLICASLLVEISACGGDQRPSRAPVSSERQRVTTHGAPNSYRAPTAEATRAFEGVVTEYAAATREGKLASASCPSMARKFQAVFERYGQQMSAAGFNAALLLETCGTPDQAEQLYRDLSKAKFGPAMTNLAVLHLRAGREQQAVDLFEGAVELDRVRAITARLNLAHIYRQRYVEDRDLEHFRRAESHTQNVLAVDASHQLAYERLAELYFDRGRLRDESYLLLAGLVIDSGMRVLEKTGRTSPDLHNLRGRLLQHQGHSATALRQFQKAVEIDPEHTEAQLNLALRALRVRDFGAAETSLKVVLKTQRPGLRTEALLAMGVAQRGLRRFQQARGLFEKAARGPNADPRGHYNLGILAQDHDPGDPGTDQQNQRYATARGHYEAFLAASTNDQHWHALREDAKLRMMHIDDAMTSMRELAALEAKAKALEEAARAAEKLERERLLRLEAEAAKSQ